VQYTIRLTIDPTTQHLLDVMAAHLPVEFHPDALATVLVDGALADGKTVRLSAAGHVAVQAAADAEGTHLQIDANRRNIKVVRAICDAWTAAFDPSLGEHADEARLVAFRRAVEVATEG